MAMRHQMRESWEDSGSCYLRLISNPAIIH
jgi:hypothetical protein